MNIKRRRRKIDKNCNNCKNQPKSYNSPPCDNCVVCLFVHPPKYIYIIIIFRRRTTVQKTCNKCKNENLDPNRPPCNNCTGYKRPNDPTTFDRFHFDPKDEYYDEFRKSNML
jgi:hypothetical protein